MPDREVRLLDELDVQRSITRLAHEIIERNRGVENLGVVGIRTRGVDVARRIATAMGEIAGGKIDVGVLDVTMYRDDFRIRKVGPQMKVTDIPFEIDNTTVLLIDDVLYTGRTARAALDALIAYGRPARVQLAVLVDRGHRELPIKADFVGKNIPTSSGENVQVRIREVDGVDEVVLIREPGEDS
ncbi:MAG: Bifunctional protein PyrR [Calditrichaeota bacterium]|nr:Bifunctional protein PyrR [Calditrichota bacterium]